MEDENELGQASERTTAGPTTEAAVDVIHGKGIIKSWVAEKGFGFINRYGESDLFFHFSELLDIDKTVEVGQKVAFEVEPSRKKPGTLVAVKVRRQEG